MCEICESIQQLFNSRKNSFEKYQLIMRSLTKLEQKGLVELYAGDCLLSEALDVLKQERHYTVCHYVKCQCENYYFIGACVRGTPKYHLIHQINESEINRKIWGKHGTYYLK